MTRNDDEKRPTPASGVTRRGFIGAIGAGAVGAAVTPTRLEAHAIEITPAGARRDIVLRVNGRAHAVSVEPRSSLLSVLRETLGLTGTKPGCERAECGACTVLIDERPRYACQTLAVEAEGAEITTIEGVAQGGRQSTVAQAFVEEDALQCGYCTPGQVMAAEGLLRGTARPSRDQVREGMSGNLCRCGAYDHICRAVLKAGDRMAAKPAAPPVPRPGGEA